MNNGNMMKLYCAFSRKLFFVDFLKTNILKSELFFANFL